MQFRYLLWFLLIINCFSTSLSAQYINSLAHQAGNPVVYPGTNNNLLLRIEVEIGTSPVVLTNLECNANGSSSPNPDIENFKLYYYNDSNAFNLSLATLIGTNTNPWSTNFGFLTAPNANYSGMSSFGNMVPGKNYFWLTHDLSPSATVCNQIDGEFIQVQAGSIYIPSLQNPPGFSIIGPCPTSISESPIVQLVTITPNPATDLIKIHFNKKISEHIRVELIDITGKKIVTLFEGIHHPGGESLQFSISEIPAGCYFIRMSNATIESTNLFIKL